MSTNVDSTNSVEVATLGGGCFWCLEAVFEQLDGMRSVVSGYAGGKSSKPSYREVCSGTTGHAEVVQVIFDPAVVSFGEVLAVFFATHDPTTLNRQGNDVGTQYRSVVYYHSPAQRAIADETIKRLNAEVFDGRIVTEVSPITEFFAAEEYHQGYFRGNPEQPYCQYVVSPKVAKFRKQFANQLKS